MKNKIIVSLIFVLQIAYYSTSFSQNTGLALRVSTLGIGIEATRNIIPTLNGRVGINYFSYNYAGENKAEDIKYDLDSKMLSFSALADWYPFTAKFHISGGILYNASKIEGTGNPTRSYTVGGTIYTPEKMGYLDATVEPDLSFTPYLGLGWGNPVQSNKKISFMADIGLIYQGSPDVTLTAHGLMEPTAEQEPDVEDDIKNLKFYPVISLGLSYKF